MGNKMIEKIQIRYFRAHKKIDIEFSPFVNSIIGRNAAGKSTIIRAIRWVVKNKPSGNSVINWDSKKAAVRIIFNKDKITRTRSKTINSYKLNGKEYKAFGNDVPEDIKKAFNLSDINFQGQHEAPFWFCESAGEVSRQLNSIVNLQVIDDTLSNISSGIRKAKTNIEIITDRLKDAEDDRTKLTFVKEMDKELSHIEFIQKVKQGNAVKCSVLSDL